MYLEVDGKMSEWIKWVRMSMWSYFFDGKPLCTWERWKKVHEPTYCGHPHRPTEYQLLKRELEEMELARKERMAAFDLQQKEWWDARPELKRVK